MPPALDQSPPTTTQPSASPKTSPSEDGKSLLGAETPSEEKTDEAGAEGAPEKYSDFKVPEGYELDSKVLAEISPIFKKDNLSQAQAQELVDLYVKHAREAFEAPFNAYLETRKGWRTEIQNDPQIGGKLDAVKASIGRLIDSFGNDLAGGFRRAMDETGAGDNPAVVKALFALSQRLTEGTSVRGNGPSAESQLPPGRSAQPSAAQAIYPHLPSSTG